MKCTSFCLAMTAMVFFSCAHADDSFSDDPLGAFIQEVERKNSEMDTLFENDTPYIETYQWNVLIQKKDDPANIIETFDGITILGGGAQDFFRGSLTPYVTGCSYNKSSDGSLRVDHQTSNLETGLRVRIRFDRNSSSAFISIRSSKVNSSMTRAYSSIPGCMITKYDTEVLEGQAQVAIDDGGALIDLGSNFFARVEWDPIQNFY